MAKTRRVPDHVPPEVNPTVRHLDLIVCLLLLTAILMVYGQVRNFDFVNIDDRPYVANNAKVRAGLNWDGLRWAFTTDYDGNWFPLTWLSHMLDCQLFGLDAGLHHLVNVLLHAVSTLLLFVLFKRVTGARWRSALVAFLFGLHPLHVESVAWVAERKDVLSGFFWILTLWFYVRYVAEPRLRSYVPVFISFSLGLLSKSMVVTLPLVLLLFDVWPLRRIDSGTAPATAHAKQKSRSGQIERRKIAAVLLEKVPLLALSAAVAVVTFVVQRRGGAVAPLDHLSLQSRLVNSLLSYITYVIKVLWPTGLAVFYPQPPNWPVWQVAAAAVSLAAISFLVVRAFRSFPYLAVGWFWYLGTLVPVIGLVQVGMQSHADRYTYLPSIGILIMMAWGMDDVVRAWPRARTVLAATSALFCGMCLILTWHQIRVWRDSTTLFEHALEVTTDNNVAHNGLGIALSERGRWEEAIAHYREAIRLRPGDPEGHANLGAALLRQGGRTKDAIRQLEEAVRLNPGALEARIDLGIAYHTEGETEKAKIQLLDALKVQPDSADAHYNLGRVYADEGRFDEAADRFTEAAKLQPDNAQTHYNLGITRARLGDMNAAIAEFTRALQINPDYAAAHNNLGSALASQGKLDEAILHFKEALRLMPGSEETRRNLEYALSLKK